MSCSLWRFGICHVPVGDSQQQTWQAGSTTVPLKRAVAVMNALPTRASDAGSMQSTLRFGGGRVSYSACRVAARPHSAHRSHL